MPNAICKCGCEFFKVFSWEDVCDGCRSDRLASRPKIGVCGSVVHIKENQFANERGLLNSDGVCRFCDCRGRVSYDSLCSACFWSIARSRKHGTRLHDKINHYEADRHKRIVVEQEMLLHTQAIQREEESAFNSILAEERKLQRHMPISICKCGCKFFRVYSCDDVCAGCMIERIASRPNIGKCGSIEHHKQNQFANARGLLQSDGVCKLCGCFGRVSYDFLCSGCSWSSFAGSRKHGTTLHDRTNHYEDNQIKKIAAEKAMSPSPIATRREEKSAFNGILEKDKMLRQMYPIRRAIKSEQASAFNRIWVEDKMLRHMAINREERSAFSRIVEEDGNLRRHMPIIESECAICMQNFARASVRRVLPCRHQFHESCVNTWIQIHHNCPTCRAAVV